MNKEELEKIHNNIEARIIDERNIGYLRNKYSPHLMDTINLYNETINLQHQLEKKDKVIDEAIDLTNHMIKELDKRDMLHPAETELLEILERGKNGS